LLPPHICAVSERGNPFKERFFAAPALQAAFVMGEELFVGRRFWPEIPRRKTAQCLPDHRQRSLRQVRTCATNCHFGEACHDVRRRVSRDSSLVRGFARKSKKLRRWIAATHDHHDHKTLRLCRTSFFNHQHRRAHAGNHHYVWRSFHARFIYRVSVRDSPRIFCSLACSLAERESDLSVAVWHCPCRSDPAGVCGAGSGSVMDSRNGVQRCDAE
jgi:hypothetical protein